MLEGLFGFSSRLEWPSADLPKLQGIFDRSLQALGGRTVDRDGVYRRLSETLVGKDLHPPDRPLWDRACNDRLDPASIPWDPGRSSTRKLDEGAWKRLSLLVDGLREPETGEVFRQRCVETGVATVCLRLLPGFALWSEAMTPELLLQNPFRVEEFARKWIDALGAPIAGESAKVSLDRLRELDFSGSVARVDQARSQAEQNRLRQEELERRRRDEYERYQRE